MLTSAISETRWLKWERCGLRRCRSLCVVGQSSVRRELRSRNGFTVLNSESRDHEWRHQVTFYMNISLEWTRLLLDRDWSKSSMRKNSKRPFEVDFFTNSISHKATGLLYRTWFFAKFVHFGHGGSKEFIDISAKLCWSLEKWTWPHFGKALSLPKNKIIFFQ